jgi:hypothetical protein
MDTGSSQSAAKRARKYTPYRHIEPHVGSVPVAITNEDGAGALAAMLSPVHLALHIIVCSYKKHYCDVVPAGGVIFSPTTQEGPYVFVPANNTRGLILPFKVPRYMCNVPFRIVKDRLSAWNARVIQFFANASTKMPGYQISPVHCDVVCSRMACRAHRVHIIAPDKLCGLNYLKNYKAGVDTHVHKLENMDACGLGFAVMLDASGLLNEEANGRLFSPRTSGYAIYGTGPPNSVELPNIVWPLHDAVFPCRTPCVVSEALRVIATLKESIRVVQCETVTPVCGVTSVDEMRQCALTLVTSEVRAFLGDVAANTIMTVYMPRAFASIRTMKSVRAGSINIVWLADLMFVSEIATLVTMCVASGAQLILVSDLKPSSVSPVARMCRPGCMLESRICRRGSKLWIDQFAPTDCSVLMRYLTKIDTAPAIPVADIYASRLEYAVLGQDAPVRRSGASFPDDDDDEGGDGLDSLLCDASTDLVLNDDAL